MITLDKQKEGLDLADRLIKRSFESSSFRNELLNNPYSAIESVYGNSISREVNIIVEDQSNPAYIYLNIPAKLNFEEIELTDEQLEIVSGGEVLASVGVGAIIVGAGLVGAGLGYLICKAID